MRIFHTDKATVVRQRALQMGAALVTVLGLTTTPAMAQDNVPMLRAAVMQLAMLPGGMMPLPTMSMSGVPATVASDTSSDATVAATSTEATDTQSARQDDADVIGNMPLAAARVDDEQLGSQRGRNMEGGTIKSPGMMLTSRVTLWDELPGAVTPTPRPQQLSNGVNNVQVMSVTYSTR